MIARLLLARPVTISIVLGTFAWGLVSLHPDTRPATAQQAALSGRATVMQQFFDAHNRGDVDTAMAAFADNAVFIGARVTGNCSQQAPCTEPAGIRQQIQGNVAIHSCFTLVDVDVAGAVVTGRMETRNDTIRSNGIDHIRQEWIALIPQDKVTFFTNLSDAGDSQTALNSAITTGTKTAGAALPNPPCTGS